MVGNNFRWEKLGCVNRPAVLNELFPVRRAPVQCVFGLNLKWPVIVPVRAAQSLTLTPSCAVVNVGLKEAWSRGVDVPDEGMSGFLKKRFRFL